MNIYFIYYSIYVLLELQMEGVINCCYYDENNREFIDYKIEVSARIVCENEQKVENIMAYYNSRGIDRNNFVSEIFERSVYNIQDCFKDNFFSRHMIFTSTKEDINLFLSGEMTKRYEELAEMDEANQTKETEREAEELSKKLTNMEAYLNNIPSDYFLNHKEQVRNNMHLIDPKTIEKNIDKLPWDFSKMDDIIYSITKRSDSPASFILGLSEHKDVRMKKVLLSASNISRKMVKYIAIKDIISRLDVDHLEYKQVYKELYSKFLTLEPDFTGKVLEYNRRIKLVKRLYKKYSKYMRKK